MHFSEQIVRLITAYHFLFGKFPRVLLSSNIFPEPAYFGIDLFDLRCDF